ncbi:MAG: putative SOS response-associated peptidase YedK [Burkholderiaceae bacterium]|jgi:putative SOS response-associated peptidase YedK
MCCGSHHWRWQYALQTGTLHAMCANYQPPTRADLQDYFGTTLPVGVDLPEAYPGSLAPIIRRVRDATDQHSQSRRADLAMFGLVPHWAESALARRTYNARTETVATKPSFRDAYRHGRFCVIPTHPLMRRFVSAP